MAKKIIKKVKVRAQAAKATPAPPLGPTLGQAGINIGDFVTKFNAASGQAQGFTPGETVGVKITVYEDRTYDFTVTTPPVANLLMKAAGIEKGSGKPNTSKAGKVTKAQIEEIAKRKMVDLNAKDLAGAMKIVEGSARSAGIEVKG
jgi:large subunit ribosomal protein L11